MQVETKFSDRVLVPIRHSGRVQWFNPTKGYGFIVSREFAKPVFVHRSEILHEDKQLYAAEAVEFESVETEKGMAAKRVKPTQRC